MALSAPRVARWLVILAALTAAAAAVAWLVRAHNAVSPPSRAAFAGRRGAAAGRVQPVSVAAVERRDIALTVSAIGSIAPASTAVVHPQVDGELRALHYVEGQPVRAGQLLAEIDPRPFQIALKQAEGQLERDRATLANARLDLQRYQDLLAKDAAPRQQADTQAALVGQLQGTVRADEAALDNARLQLSYTRVVAPIAGLAGLAQADLGNIVHGSDPNGLVTIAQTQPASVVFAVPDANLSRIRARLAAGAALRVEAWDRAQQTLLAQGSVSSTDNAIDASTGTIRVKARFPNADNALFPNQSVNVRLQLDVLAGATAVPAAAVQRGAPGSYVYAVDDGGTARLVRVEVAAVDGDWAAVQGALQPGERVVIDGADRLRDGAPVEVIEPVAPGARAARAGSAASAGRAAHAGTASAAESATSEASSAPGERRHRRAAAPAP